MPRETVEQPWRSKFCNYTSDWLSGRARGNQGNFSGKETGLMKEGDSEMRHM